MNHLDHAGAVGTALAGTVAAVVGGILAVSDNAWAAFGLLGAALIAALGGLAVAVVQARAARIAIRDQAEKIGTPNGHGTIAEMMAKLLDGQTGQDMRLAVIETHQIEQAERLDKVEETQRTICSRVHVSGGD